ncbi:MAG: hypothetical protein NTY48_03165, partial [Candidatus Diapherotrites archaeon]|nr:hypothetical protein [Candidatus Diapherotrites archaeon]
MKPAETSKILTKRHSLIMWICFLYGGFAIILFALDVYTAFWSGGTIFSSTFSPAVQLRDFDHNIIEARDLNHSFPMQRPEFNPMRLITSPFSIAFLISGIISLAAGYTILTITREKEIKKIREEAADMFLLPDEKKVIDMLKRNNYSLTQSQLTKETGLNKVQVHRVIKRLEAK